MTFVALTATSVTLAREDGGVRPGAGPCGGATSHSGTARGDMRVPASRTWITDLDDPAPGRAEAPPTTQSGPNRDPDMSRILGPDAVGVYSPAFLSGPQDVEQVDETVAFLDQVVDRATALGAEGP